MSKYLAITGGVGGAKLALGLSKILTPAELAFVVNTGDDFQHIGLHVSPDVDTLMYTLAGLDNPETGWGRVGESWNFIETFAGLGGESWFNLGDRDLAVHARRTQLLRAGHSLSDVIHLLYAANSIPFTTWPMSDDPAPTRVLTDAGELDFQHYFVRERCQPVVKKINLAAAGRALANPKVLEFLSDPDLAGVVICPSNPFLSIDPLLAMPELRSALAATQAPVIAISPLVGGDAVKGPTAKIMRELGLPQDAGEIASHYGDLLDGFVLDQTDADLEIKITHSGLAVRVAQTFMQTLDDRVDLAQTALGFLQQLK
mgnify:CR=1 FL=1